LKNPFFLGFFATIVIHVLIIVYMDIINRKKISNNNPNSDKLNSFILALDLRRFLDRYSIIVTLLVTISVYKILTVKTGKYP
jgi:hypothetical protein